MTDGPNPMQARPCASEAARNQECERPAARLLRRGKVAFLNIAPAFP